jgi:hypothetical protein
MKAVRPRRILPWPRLLAAAALVFAVVIALGALLQFAVLAPAVPSASSASSAASGAPLASSPSSAPALGFVCPPPTEPATPTPAPTAAPSPRKPGAAPRGWPVSLASMEATGRLADDGTSYFIEGDYLVAVDGSGHERAGWPQPLGFRADLNTPVTFGADGTVYAWDENTVVAYRADGTRPAGWPYHAPAIEEVLPVPRGVYVESEPSGSAACGDERHVMTLIGTTGAVQSTWTLQGEIAAVGPDGTIYSGQAGSILAYASDGAVKPGWPATGWSNVSLDSSGHLFLWWWKFREMSGISMEGPGEALETKIAAVDQNGRPYAGWPVTIEGAASAPAFGPDGTVYVTRETYASGSSAASDSVLALDADGKSKPGWPVALPAGHSLLRSVPGVSASAPDPPHVGSDGTVYFGATTAEPSSPGVLEALDPSGRLVPGFPCLIDWLSMSNMFAGPDPAGSQSAAPGSCSPATTTASWRSARTARLPRAGRSRHLRTR